MEDSKQLKEDIESLISAARDREAGRKALAILFPKAEGLLKAYVYSGPDDIHERKQQRRISIPEFAPQYFRLTPSPAHWSRSEIERILTQSDPSTLIEDIKKKITVAVDYERPRLRRRLLEQIESAFGPNRSLTAPWLSFLVSISSSFIKARDEVTIALFPDENADRLRRIVLRGLISPPPAERSALFKAIIPEAKDISLLCDVYRAIEDDVQESDHTRNHQSEVTLGPEAQSVRTMLVARVESLTASQEIWAQAQPARILWFWYGSGREKDVRNFTDKAIQDVVGLRALLEVPISLVRSSNGNYEQVAQYWNKIVNLQSLADEALQILQESRSEADRQLAQRFINALNRKDRE